MKLQVKKGRTSLLVKLFIQDSSSSVGAGLTGLTSGSAGLTCYRARDDDGNAGGTAITLSGGTRGTWSSGGFVEKDATNMPGVYEFGVPDAAIATGSETSLIMFKGATNMAPCLMELQLVAIDLQDATSAGLSRLDAAITSRLASGNVTVGTNNDKTGYSLTQTFPTNFSSLSVDASGRVDVIKVAGTTQTARDIGNALPTAAPGAAGGLETVGNMRLQKNAAYNNFTFPMFDSADHITPKTGLTITATRSIDGGTFAACANTASEIATTSGVYKINLAATDVNGDSVVFKFTATGADPMVVSVVTQIE